MTRALVLLLPGLLAALAGCGATVKMLPESLDCPVLPERLSTACAASRVFPISTASSTPG